MSHVIIKRMARAEAATRKKATSRPSICWVHVPGTGACYIDGQSGDVVAARDFRPQPGDTLSTGGGKGGDDYLTEASGMYPEDGPMLIREYYPVGWDSMLPWVLMPAAWESVKALATEVGTPYGEELQKLCADAAGA